MYRCLATGWLLAASVGAQVWSEAGDAWSFPDGNGQQTRGSGALVAIEGSTDTAAGDLRDAYCIRITDPGAFLATTDPATDEGASGNFDTCLFLFRPDGAPVLAQDDTPAADGSLSTLTGVATDGSGFILSQPGEYVLVVGATLDEPQDGANVDLFDIASDLELVHAANPAAGRFDHWQASRICLGDGAGGFTCSDLSAGVQRTVSVALGFVNGDQFLDAILTNQTNVPSEICLGDGAGAFTCSSLESHYAYPNGGALGEVMVTRIFSDGFESGDTTAWSSTVPTAFSSP